MEVSPGYWIGFIAFIILMLMLDLGVFHKKDTVVGIKEAIGWSVFWISLALLFNVGIYCLMGKVRAVEFFTAYVLEKSLSVDNLFVFIMIFGYFGIAPRYQHKILFWGIFGALIMRAIFIFAGVTLIQKFSWIMYLFGAFLIYTGIHMVVGKEEEEEVIDPNKNFVIRLFRKMMPVRDDAVGSHFFVRKERVLYATPFFVALLFIEASDVVFAVDSIPAVLSVSKDVFIVFTSNIFAILGLRSLYFALNGVMGYFYYLRYALAGVLSFIGLKMCVNEFCAHFGYAFHISNYVSLGIIVALLTLSVLLSLVKKKREERF
jgi:tellurite resistance protein TerC